MNIKSVPSKVTCDPKTIWPLNESARHAAVTSLVQKCAEDFKTAALKNDPGAAQDSAIFALGAFGGLFPDPNNAAHVLLTSLEGMLTDAKSGRTGHILTRSTNPILGTKRGFGHAYVGGFAISAAQILIDRNQLSVLRARQQVATLLARAGYSLRKDDHDQAKPITASAIRNWCDNSADYPLHHEIAGDMKPIHADNLTRRNAVTPKAVLAYLQDQAEVAILHSRGL